MTPTWGFQEPAEQPGALGAGVRPSEPPLVVTVTPVVKVTHSNGCGEGDTMWYGDSGGDGGRWGHLRGSSDTGKGAICPLLGPQ